MSINRTILELKRISDEVADFSLHPINRTILELKQNVHLKTLKLLLTINRTILELKLENIKRICQAWDY